ncbi:Uncharacterised protein [Chryseobacterium nakagawai]|uniref:hypothetical protein n=1 Tax=Chryseobacterium nakagawai TaxID=1241982 RepID=UPI000F6DE58F|nr:hypothetical protein [Chryseobacterium nakagawai]VEH22737.1 Uncharacterised protein [Chryseobacterium nakagawai]
MAFVDLLGQTQRKMRHIRENGELIPIHFGFHTWNQFDKGKYLMGSRKCTLLLGGEPNHGKSQVTKELVMQLVEKHNHKVALFCTEDGDVEKLFSIYCHMYQGKPYTKVRPDGSVNPYAMTDAEADEAEHYLLDKIYIFKQNRKETSYQTLDNIYKQLEKAELHYGIKFDTLVVDPIYDVDDFEPKADEVLRCLNRINLEAEENNRFDIIVNHVAETHKTFDPKTGKRKKHLALADEFYGGKNNNRKAMLQILVHRPEPNVDENGKWLEGHENDSIVIRPNQTNIHILKVKPEGIAKWGVYDIYFDFKSRRYYEDYIENETTKFAFASCTKFYDRSPVSTPVNINQFRFTPEEAFGNETRSTQPISQPVYTGDDDDDFPF